MNLEKLYNDIFQNETIQKGERPSAINMHFVRYVEQLWEVKNNDYKKPNTHK